MRPDNDPPYRTMGATATVPRANHCRQGLQRSLRAQRHREYDPLIDKETKNPESVIFSM